MGVFQSMSIRSRLVAIAGLVLVSFVAFAAMPMLKSENAREYKQALSEYAQIAHHKEIAFHKQLRSWDQALLSLDSPALYDQYWREFLSAREDVEDGFEKISKFYLETGGDLDILSRTRTGYTNLMESYMSAMEESSAEDWSASDIIAKVQGQDADVIGLFEKLVNESRRHVDQLVWEGDEAFTKSLMAMALVVGAIILISLYVVTRNVTSSLSRLASISSDFKENKLSIVSDKKQPSEVSYLSEVISELGQQNIINRACLEGLANNVLIADEDDIIRFANKASLENLTNLTDDIRKQFSSFDVNKLVGASIHNFHKNPDAIRNILRALKPGQQHRAHIKIGPLTLNLNVGAMFDANGKRVGSYAEWRDVTQELAREKREKASEEAKKRTEQRVFEVANMINDATRDIAQGNIDLSERTEAQAASIEQTTATMQQITERVNESANNAKQALDIATTTREAANRGGDIAKDAIEAMEEISRSSTQISEIIGVIDEIAFQTNLLALNAAVEAARAGEQGRGFAVVASEVRSLAGRSAKAAKEIKDLITESVSKVKAGTEQVNETGQCLTDIIKSVQDVAQMVSGIADASQEQAMSISEINKSVNQMDSFTQKNAALVEEAASASKSLEEQASNLVKVINSDEADSTASAAVYSEPREEKKVSKEKSSKESQEQAACPVDGDGEGEWSEV